MTPEQFSRSIRAAAETRDWAEVHRVSRAQAWCVLGQTLAHGLAALVAQCRALAHRSASGRMVGSRGD